MNIHYKVLECCRIESSAVFINSLTVIDSDVKVNAEL